MGVNALTLKTKPHRLTAVELLGIEIKWVEMLLAFSVGAIPFGWLVVRAHGKNLLEIGSGSMGTTNVVRAVGWPSGLLVLCLDISKGAVPVGLAQFWGFSPGWIIFLGVCAILGHSFSPFLKFKGGKGAATGIGVLLMLSPGVFGVTALTVIVIVALTRYQSVGTLVGVWIPPIWFYGGGYPSIYIVWTILAAIFIWVKHRANIQRLLKGQEIKIGKAR